MLTSFKEIVQRIVNAKTKKDLRSGAIVPDLDIYYFKGHYLSYNTFSKVQIYDFNNKYSSHFKKPKNKDSKPAPPYGNMTELAKKKNKIKRL